MKRLIYSLGLSMVILTSCSSDKIGENYELYGNWKLIELSTSNPIDLNNNGTLTTSFQPGCLLGSELIIKDDSNGSLFYSSIVSYFTRTENNEIVYITSCVTDSDNIPFPITYLLENETIYLNNNGEISVLTVVDNQLQLVIENGFVTRDETTLEITQTQDLTYIFSKD